MKLLVIHSDFGDPDTSYIDLLISGIDCNYVHITKDMDPDTAIDTVTGLLEYEDYDLLLWYGHGSRYGLMYPDWNHADYYLINDDNSKFIKSPVIGISCYASDFAKSNNLHGVFTGMFISNMDEAVNNCIETTSSAITECDKHFSDIINQALKSRDLFEFMKLWLTLMDLSIHGDQLYEFNIGNIEML